MAVVFIVLIVIVLAELELATRAADHDIRGARVLGIAALAQLIVPVLIFLGLAVYNELVPEVRQPGSWWFSPREGRFMVALFWSQTTVMALSLALAAWIGTALRKQPKGQPT